MRQMPRANALPYEWDWHVVPIGAKQARPRGATVTQACSGQNCDTCVGAAGWNAKEGAQVPVGVLLSDAIGKVRMSAWLLLHGGHTRLHKIQVRISCCLPARHGVTTSIALCTCLCPCLYYPCAGTAIPTSIALFAVLAIIVLGLITLLFAVQYLIGRRRAAQTADRTSKWNITMSLRKLLGRSGARDFSGFTKKLCPISLEFDNLGLTLAGSGLPVLEGVTGKFDHSQLIAIMGPSGAGKTSFLNVLCGKVIRINLSLVR